MISDEPVGPAEAETLLEGLSEASGIVVGVSGGPDSTALLGLLADWRRPGRPEILAVTVDHGLRPTAAEEARLAAAVAARLAVPHRVLAWTGPKPASGLQEAARAARYGLVAAAALEAGASHIVTAHTLDDQAETVLMRLSRGSGLSGLAGMRRVSGRGGLVHARPLLGLPKSRLVATCRANGWPFADDPSNRDPRFARSRWRDLMPALAAEGLTPVRIACLAERAARADEALDRAARRALRSAEAGPGAWRARSLAEEPEEIALRMLLLMLPGDAGGRTTIRLERAEALCRALRDAAGRGVPLRRTLAGQVVRIDARGRLSVAAEPARSRGTGGGRKGDAAGVPHSLGKG